MSYAPQKKLRDYQVEALEKMDGREAFACLMAMRTGKTAVALADFGQKELDGTCDSLLVIAPGGVYRTWEGQIQEHLSLDLLKRVQVYTWESGKSMRDAELVRFLDDTSRPSILLVNVEALSLSTTGARACCERFLALRKSSMVVVDESTIIKAPKAERTKYVCWVIGPRAKYRRILSGLPTPRSPLDLYHQFEFLDKNILQQSTFMKFQERYAITRKVKWPGARWPTVMVVGYKNIDELPRLIEPHSFRVPFRPDIPPTYTIRHVKMTDEQARIYAQLKTFATAQLENEEHVTAHAVITQMLRLHQVLCGHVVTEDGSFRAIKENRTREVLEIMEDYDGKAVVWCSYDHDVRKVAAALQEEYGASSVARFWGGNVNTREAEEKQFKSDPACRFMVATPDAGGRGRTWDVANLVVYFSNRDNLEFRDQSEQRAQNVGKSVGVDYVDLVCPGTVDEPILGALRKKIDLSALITGDDWRKWVI
jgi:SNF2 family DNA or RNA helicase